MRLNDFIKSIYNALNDLMTYPKDLNLNYA